MNLALFCAIFPIVVICIYLISSRTQLEGEPFSLQFLLLSSPWRDLHTIALLLVLVRIARIMILATYTCTTGPWTVAVAEQLPPPALVLLIYTRALALLDSHIPPAGFNEHPCWLALLASGLGVCSI